MLQFYDKNEFAKLMDIKLLQLFNFFALFTSCDVNKRTKAT